MERYQSSRRVCGRGWIAEYRQETGFSVLSGDDAVEVLRIIPDNQIFVPETRGCSAWISGKMVIGAYENSADDRYDDADSRYLIYPAQNGEVCVFLYRTRFPTEETWELLPEPSVSILAGGGEDGKKNRITLIHKIPDGGQERFFVWFGNSFRYSEGALSFFGGWQAMLLSMREDIDGVRLMTQLKVQRDARNLLDDLPSGAEFVRLTARRRWMENQIRTGLCAWKKESLAESVQTAFSMLIAYQTPDGVFRASQNLAFVDQRLSGVAAVLFELFGMKQQAHEVLSGMQAFLAMQGFAARVPQYRRLTYYEKVRLDADGAYAFLEAALYHADSAFLPFSLAAWEHLIAHADQLSADRCIGLCNLGKVLSSRIPEKSEIIGVQCRSLRDDRYMPSHFSDKERYRITRAARLNGGSCPSPVQAECVLAEADSLTEYLEKLIYLLQN